MIVLHFVFKFYKPQRNISLYDCIIIETYMLGVLYVNKMLKQIKNNNDVLFATDIVAN